MDDRDRPAEQVGPEDQALLADSVGPAMPVVLDTLHRDRPAGRAVAGGGLAALDEDG